MGGRGDGVNTKIQPLDLAPESGSLRVMRNNHMSYGLQSDWQGPIGGTLEFRS